MRYIASQRFGHTNMELEKLQLNFGIGDKKKKIALKTKPEQKKYTLALKHL